MLAYVQLLGEGDELFDRGVALHTIQRGVLALEFDPGLRDEVVLVEGIAPRHFLIAFLKEDSFPFLSEFTYNSVLDPFRLNSIPC